MPVGGAAGGNTSDECYNRNTANVIALHAILLLCVVEWPQMKCCIDAICSNSERPPDGEADGVIIPLIYSDVVGLTV